MSSKSSLTPDQGVGRSARVTVIIPCFNDGVLLLEAIGSIQEPEHIEVIVVDDCSDDPETIVILGQLSDWGSTMLRHDENQGQAEARNTGLRAARTPYVFPLDADDLVVPGILAAMADRLDANPQAAVCFGDYLEFGTHELIRAVPLRIDGFRLAYVNEYPVSSLLRRSLLLSLGGWRAPVTGYEDWDVWLTLAERGVDGIHMGAGTLIFKKRFHGERMLTFAKRQHRELYQRIRQDHPAVFQNIDGYRRNSGLPLHRKLLYPIVYGRRRRYNFERHVKHQLDRWGIWTLRR